jgi:hypothetical protein
MVGQILITFEAVWEGSGRPGLLTFLAREEVNALFGNYLTFKAVATILINLLQLRWALCCMDAWDKTGRR